VTALRRKNEELVTANREILEMTETLRETYDGTLEALVTALDARDRETKGHSTRVTEYTLDIARHMGLKPGTSPGGPEAGCSPSRRGEDRGFRLHPSQAGSPHARGVERCGVTPASPMRC